MEVSLLVFYGCLLLITPAFSGLISGRLPVEISTRGAKFTEGAGRYAALDEATIKNLEETTAGLDQALAKVQIEIGELSEIIASDNTQREVDSPQ